MEDKDDLNNELSNNSCFNKQRRIVGDSVTSDTIISLVRLQFYFIKNLYYFQLFIFN